jgi:hypothetical protein
MDDQLRAFLREMAGTPFSWADGHCAFAVADWVEIVTGADPVPEWRGLHRTEEAWRAAVEREGGLARLIARIARRSGAKPTRRPDPGGFGVIRVGERQVSVIMTPTGRWAGKSPSGLMVILKGPRMAWTFAGR